MDFGDEFGEALLSFLIAFGMGTFGALFTVIGIIRLIGALVQNTSLWPLQNWLLAIILLWLPAILILHEKFLNLHPSTLYVFLIIYAPIACFISIILIFRDSRD